VREGERERGGEGERERERVSERERERNRGSMCVRVCLAEQTPAVIAAPLLTITCSLLNTFATLVT